MFVSVVDVVEVVEIVGNVEDAEELVLAGEVVLVELVEFSAPGITVVVVGV